MYTQHTQHTHTHTHTHTVLGTLPRIGTGITTNAENSLLEEPQDKEERDLEKVASSEGSQSSVTRYTR